MFNGLFNGSSDQRIIEEKTSIVLMCSSHLFVRFQLNILDLQKTGPRWKRPVCTLSWPVEEVGNVGVVEERLVSG